MSNSMNGKKDSSFWKSLKEYYDDPEILKAKANEFNDGVTDDFDTTQLSGISRRRFIALLTASAAVTATACSDYQDKGEIIPYNKRPEGVLPGTPNYYASTIEYGNDSYGVLIKTREGRPIKIDGNPEHPINKGKINEVIQASILNLYDPERLSDPLDNKRKTNWNAAEASVIEKLNDAVNNNKEIAVLTNRVNSPSYKKVISEFVNKYKTAKHYSYELFDDVYRTNAWQKSYPGTKLPSIKWDEANVILAIDSDFLGREGNTLENTRLYTERRDVMVGANFNRLYVAENALSLTGMNSDYRFRIRPDAKQNFVLSLLNELILKKSIGSVKLDSAAKNLISKYSLSDFAKKNELDSIKLSYLVDDLIQNQGKAIVYAGNSASEETHLAVNLLNEVLSNTNIYDLQNGFNSVSSLSTNDEIKNLQNDINNGNVSVLINIDADPIYHFSSNKSFVESISKVETKISLIESENDTSVICNYVFPINHALESWGDYHSRNSVYSFQQPVIAPLFNTREKEAILLTWISGASKNYTEDIYQKFIMKNVENTIYKSLNTPVSFKSFWQTALHDGFVSLKTDSKLANYNEQSINNIKNNISTDEYLVSLQPSYFIGDGKYANNGWLQEIAHPVSKVTWDNYAAVSPTTAKELNLSNNDVIELTVGENKVNIGIIIQPGNADKVFTIELGYGRNIIGDAGLEAGVNANTLLGIEENSKSKYYSVVSVSKTGKTYDLVSTQEHHAIDDTFVKDFHRIRKIIQEGTVEEYKKHPEFLHEHKHNLFSISKEVKYEGMKWAMAIDLNKCTSCANCITSCNIENNIPVVGKEQVAVGREMQWIRLDRYYSGTPDEPIVSTQPMLCQHCDNAPCENVCPVNATNHSPDGLNQMAYNRCVGTRYCANNCPYKVRRFNFFNFRDNFADAYYNNEYNNLGLNPEVTVRSRGVMEKCTFCVQRIMESRSEAIKENRELKGEDVVTACQSACPSNAIVFGNANDKNSEISKYREHNLSYHVLEELNVKPNVTYIAKLRNTHSEEV